MRGSTTGTARHIARGSNGAPADGWASVELPAVTDHEVVVIED
jgi:hypothetical protein